MASSGSFNTAGYEGRYLTFSWTEKSQNIANNTTTISWTLKGAGDAVSSWYKTRNIKLVIDGKTAYYQGEGSSSNYITLYNGTVVASGEYTFTHATDGTKSFTASAEAGIYVWAVNCKGSKSFTLDTIPRKSSLSVGNGALNTEQTLTVTKQHSSFTHTIIATCGSVSKTICTKSTSTSIKFTPPIDWAKQNTTGTSVSVKYTITTYNGNTSVGSNSYTKTCSIPSSVKPACSLSVSDPTGYFTTYGFYIEGLSKINGTVTATESYGSGIKSYSTLANGATYKTAGFTTGVIKVPSSGSGNTFVLSITSTVTDKRGRQGTAKQDVRGIRYSSPRITNLSVHRCNEDGSDNDQGDHVRVEFDAAVTSLSVAKEQNTARYTLEYKPTDSDEYTSINLSDYDNVYELSGVSVVFPADTGYSYNVRITVVDAFGKTGSKTSVVSTGFTVMHWLASGKGMGIGKVGELENVLDIGFQTRFNGGVLHPVLEAETDLNDIRTPNTYVGENVSSNNYANCPLTSGTFTLEVVGMGADGQVKQKVTYCHKTEARVWERIYYGNAWGEWICVSDFGGKLLWDGVYYMSASQKAELAEPVSKQRSGIVLVFSRYSSSTAQNYHFNTFFIPKYQIAAHEGCGHTFTMTTDATLGLFASKYLYLHDAYIAGHANNEASGTGACGIIYNNAGFVLRHVIGV